MNKPSQDKQARRSRLGSETSPSAQTTISGGYSLVIKSLRIVLPLIALSLVVIVLTWQPEDQKIVPPQNIEDIEQQPQPEIEQNELINPDFASQTKDGDPYRITAERAIQKIIQPDLVYLEQLTASLETDSGPVFLRANEGTYHQTTQFMTLSEDVVIRKKNAGTFYLRTLEADLQAGNAASPHPVRGESRNGLIEGKGLNIHQNGERIIVHGPARLVLNNGLDAWN
jgi:LPS export ABC transporter protein LptC